MVIQVDKWHLLPEPDPGCSLTYDLMLENAQLARMGVISLVNPYNPGPPQPEVFVYSEMPGERFKDVSQQRRWVMRPPHPGCEWSRVQLPEKLLKEITVQLSASLA